MLMKIIKAGIIGSAGYTGGEMLRILINHPQVELVLIHSKSNAGKAISDVHVDLAGESAMLFSHDDLDVLKDNSLSLDVLFLCVGHGDAIKFLQDTEVHHSINIIDLSQDFRIKNKALGINRQFVYGLPELNKADIAQSKNIANPGCFATALQLGLLPLAKASLLDKVYSTGITGSTGAGQGLSITSHFSWRANNIQAYKTLTHQHLNEVSASLHQLQKSFPLYTDQASALNFVPWRGDFTRGIFISSQLECTKSLDELTSIFKTFFNDHPFTQVVVGELSLKQVVNTNKCLIKLEKTGNQLVVHSVIDNLLKGASGQAVQNMNLMFGIDETTGLRLKANAF